MKYHFDGTHSVDEIYQFNENSYVDENLSLWWKFITAIESHCYDKNYYNDEIFITLMKTHHFDENSSLRWKIINLLNIILIK